MKLKMAAKAKMAKKMAIMKYQRNINNESSCQHHGIS
jgi:hypothetical protein